MNNAEPLTLDAASKPDRDATFLRLLVQTESAGAAAELELRRAVKTALGLDATGKEWKVARLFPPAIPVGAEVEERTPEHEALETFFEVTGYVSGSYPLPQVGFELAYRLNAAGRFRSVQPDLPSTSFDPERRESIQFRAIAGGGEHLPGSVPRDWAVKKMRCPEAWALRPPAGGRSRGEGIVIGHPDTGYALHPGGIQLAALDLVRDRDLLANDDDARDPLQTGLFGWLESPGHGTGTGPDAVVSVASGATLVPIRTIKSVVVVLQGDVAKAIDYARRVGCHVISMSLGGTPFPGVEAAIGAAVADGLIVLAAAGNYSPIVVWPAAYPDCIAVGATNANDEPWAFSSRGSAVFVSAPGESVWRAQFALGGPVPKPEVERNHGTSFAVAHTAGVAALWLAYYGRDTLIARYGKEKIQAVFQHLVATSGHRRPDGWDTGNFGVGIIDAAALLSAPLPAPADVTRTREAIVAEVAVPGTRQQDSVTQVHAVCPELTRDEVEARLAALLKTTGSELQEKLGQYSPELVYHLMEDPALRAAFVRGPVAPAVRESTWPSGTIEATAVPAPFEWEMRRRASPSLAAEVSAP